MNHNSTSPFAIEAENLHRSYKIGKTNLEVLRGVSLKIAPGEKTFLCGPSGAGKTTLLYTLAGLERPQTGTVKLTGTDIYAMRSAAQCRFRNKNIGYIFQNYHLLPELTALENVMVPGAISGQNQQAAAAAALERVGLQKRATHLPTELSGGEQQRVAIARAIVNQPAILFADEPTGNLDSANSQTILHLLMELCSEFQTTLVMVTHDPSLARFGDRTLTIRDGLME
jgi:ABC-type lipoprotein export system ATPase subunit